MSAASTLQYTIARENDNNTSKLKQISKPKLSSLQAYSVCLLTCAKLNYLYSKDFYLQMN